MELKTSKKLYKLVKKVSLFFAIFLSININFEINSQTTLNRIVAKVDESIITLHDLNKRLALDNNYKQIYSTSEKIEYEKSALEMMIIDKLLQEKSEELGITINEKLLNLQLMEIYDAKSLDELKLIMKEQNEDFDEAKEMIKNSLRIEKLISSEVFQKNQVTQHEIENYEDTLEDNIEVRARQILIKLPSNHDQSDFQKLHEKATMIHDKLMNGEDFIQVSIQYSDAQNKEEGGDFGYVRKGGMPESFEEVLFSLEDGKISEIIQSDIGFHILQVVEHRKIEEDPDKLRAKITKERENELLKEYIEKLKNESIIKILL